MHFGFNVAKLISEFVKLETFKMSNVFEVEAV